MASLLGDTNLAHRLLPVVLDGIARDDPDRVLFHIPRNNSPSQGYEQVTAASLNNAVNRLCWWLQAQLGGDSAGPTKATAYIGQSKQSPYYAFPRTVPTSTDYLGHKDDLRYFIVMLASVKTGNKVLLSSPRNSAEGHRSLAEQCGCHFWFTSSGVDLVDFIRDSPRAELPELAELLDPMEVAFYRYDKTFEEGRWDLLMYLHTSGSTGLPKLIPIYLGTAATIDGYNIMEVVDGVRPNAVEWTGTKMLCAMPLFHIAGILLGFFSTVFFRWTVVLPSTGPLMQHIVEEALDNIALDSAFISPSVLQDISQSPALLKKLSVLKFLSSAGGPIPASVGNAIHPLVPIFQTYGSTEACWVASVATHPSEWQYYYFHPRTGPRFRHHSDSLFELEFVKDSALAATQPTFYAFPDLEVWRTKDLFSQHPTVPTLWKYEMRADDLIVLSNGEKFNPLGAEGLLIQHPWVSAAYITGRARFQAAALVYPGEESLVAADTLDILDKIWPTVEEANRSLPAFAQLHRDFVKVVKVPFPRTPKGTLARNEMEKAFAQEIEDMYEVSPINGMHTFETIDGASEGSIRDSLREAILTVGGISNLEDDDDLFVKGFDSLRVIRLERLLKVTAASLSLEITAKTIYSNPSVAQLGRIIWTQHQQGQSSAQQEGLLQSHATQQMISRYLPSFEGKRQAAEHIVITGTTGSIGSYLLDTLSKSDQVAGIWCLNRSRDANARQIDQARAKGLSTEQWSGKVRFVHWDPASETLGLSQGVLKEIHDRATTILHNAWEVNFNLPLSSFESQFIALKGLINICQITRHKIRFYFTSSVSAAMNNPSKAAGPVPEDEISDLQAPINGYGASKLVAEHLLRRAADNDILTMSALRVGQAAGPVKMVSQSGAWNRREWVPAMIDASAYLGLLPSDLGSATTLDWIPVDHLGDIIGEIVLGPVLGTHSQGLYYNIVNPSLSSWSDVHSTVTERLQKESSAQIQSVPFQRWIDALKGAGPSIIAEADAGSSEAARRAQGGLALLSFFQGLIDAGAASSTKAGSGLGGIGNLEWTMANSLSQSNVLANLTPVSPSWFAGWLAQWGY